MVNENGRKSSLELCDRSDVVPYQLLRDDFFVAHEGRPPVRVRAGRIAV